MSLMASHPVLPFDSPDAATMALVERLAPLDCEQVQLAACLGRVLAVPVTADRPSPPCDVSAMDGYALRLVDLSATSIRLAGEASTGRAPLELPKGLALRIVTGAPLPRGAETVIRREDVEEMPDAIRLIAPREAISAGQHIRRMGENIAEGRVVVAEGRLITPAAIAAAAAFGAARLSVRKKLRVALIVTGDELIEVSQTPRPWELRDSNGPTLCALLGPLGWAELLSVQRAVDDFQETRRMVEGALADCDALLLTGGVSMGVHDHVPDVLRACGAEVVFHKLPIRPGKPMLGAVGPNGQAIFGLPGNPVSVMVTARRLAIPTFLKKAGGQPPPPAQVGIANADDRSIPLHWFRLVTCIGPGLAELIDNRGSGDIVAASRSDGFVEQRPQDGALGPLDFYPWGFA